MQLMDGAILRDRDCSNMCPSMFNVKSTMSYRHMKTSRKHEIAFIFVKYWSESEYSMIVSRASEFMSIFRDIGLFGSVSGTAYPLLTAGNRSVGHDLLVYRTLQFEEETSYKLFIQHPPILDT
jgi:hypothetical protein